ncbi:DUF1428 domain-containing protein [Paracoccus aerodenitrificans]|uniref:DUF1428 domain-containing protein n=1 Tax=Paracoccus aerodenitrificans TaxID=3017781 RepID=UPI0022F0A7C5|nr:DUF1428 domain-containing protein [Paracoccus aerodenitrificans]WBU64071.1 DUF1428 domain-containing protein [Paracoccus aerodenitrificans]
MTYYSGMLAAVPTANKDAYLAHAKDSWPIFQELGATRMVEGWGVDVQKGKVTDLLDAVKAKDDETVVYSWVEWPDKETSDKAWEAMMSGEVGQDMPEMPFDGSRMIFGGFEPVYEQGTLDGANYIQGFAAAAPEKNKQAYIDMADAAWPSFRDKGCLGNFENWGTDVPRGKQTDFYRATKAEDGEAIVFSWNTWPDRATCDRAAEQMMAEMEGQDMPEMPFDGMRMAWGGFEKIFDSNDV